MDNNNSTEMTKEDEMNLINELDQKNNKKQRKFPMIIPSMAKIKKGKPNNSKINKKQLLIDYNKTSVNITNLRKNLPKIVTSYTPIEKRNKYTNNFKNKKNKGDKLYNLSRNFDVSLLNNCNSDNNNFFGSSKNKSKYIENDNENDISLNQNFSKISRNEDNYESNYDNSNMNYMTQNNINSINKNNNNKIKFDMNKKNIMNKIKHPSKINLNINKKNLKYKIPMDMINNLNQRKQKQSNDKDSHSINRKLNIRQKNNRYNNNINDNLSLTQNNQNIKKMSAYTTTYNNNKSNNKDLNLESTFMTFNNLVSQAKELGHILIDNKDLLKNQNFEFIESEENNELFEANNINMKSEINKLNQEIKNEHKSVEELQKINSELNDKIILFNNNAKQYEKKVEELINVINQVKNNSNNNSNNNSDNISNGISNNNNILRKNSNQNFTIEKIPKKKKLKFGFVELIFMKENKFQMIQKEKPPEYEKSENNNFLIEKQNKEPKLVFVNMNKNNDEENKINYTVNKDDYYDAASQMANHIIIESLISLKNDEKKN
jgi:hypothetical protein